MKKTLKLWDYMNEFVDAFTDQLKEDDKRWGETWLNRSRKGQEERIMHRFAEYYDEYLKNEEPIDWLKVIGNAYIAWVRENHPELFRE